MTNLPQPISPTGHVPANWGPIATNTCVTTGNIPFQAIKTITGTGTVATMLLSLGSNFSPANTIGGPAPCGISLGAANSVSSGIALTISGTNTCYDGAQTTTAVTAAQTITFNSTCTTSFSASQVYSLQAEPAKDSTGNIWVTYHYGEIGAEDAGYYVGARESTDGGATFGANTIILQDPTGSSCSSASRCGANSQAIGNLNNGNIIVLSGQFDVPLQRYVGIYQTIWNGTSWSTTTNATIANPAGQPTWCWGVPLGQIFPLPGGAIGSLVEGTASVPCGTIYTAYIVVSCDNGATWGTGTGCTGTMKRFATNNIIFVDNSSFITQIEADVAWIGGNTLVGFARNLPNTSILVHPMIMFWSTDFGNTWTSQNTNIAGAGNNSTETSPWLYNTGIGGEWTLFYGDRFNQAATPFYNQSVRQITGYPLNWIANPAGLTTGQLIFASTAPQAALGTYPGALQSLSNPYKVLIWSDEYLQTYSNARRIRYWNATYAPNGSLSVQHSATQSSTIQ